MSEKKYLQERQYLQKLAQKYAYEKPHLAEVLEPQDLQTGRLMEGFSFLSARLQEKIDDAFPEITLPLLQRLQSQAIKGIPTTTVVQFDKQGIIDFPLPIIEKTPVSGQENCVFETCQPITLQPLSIIERKIVHQPEKSCLTLTFNYRGNIQQHKMSPLMLFLSQDKETADTLLLWLCQYFERIELEHDSKIYHGDSTRFNFEPHIGEKYPILPQLPDAQNAPQGLLEGLYLDHVHHFLTLDIPTIVTQLAWENSTEFTVNIYLNRQIPLTIEQFNNSFFLNCVPTVNREDDHTVIVNFTDSNAIYTLPLPKNHCLTQLKRIELSLEPHEEYRGIMMDFYPITQLAPSSRLLPQFQHAYFYSLDIEKNILDEIHYRIHFYNSDGTPMLYPPGARFSCTYSAFERYLNGALDTITKTSEKLPDILTAENITQLTPCYPPISNDKRYWSLLSHYSANAFMLTSIDSIKQMLSDYNLYQDVDRQIYRKIKTYLDGLVAMNSSTYDRLLKGKPYRCLDLTITVDLTHFESEGAAFLFVTQLYHFFPFCLSENMLLKMTVNFNNNQDIWYLAPYLLKGYKTLI